MAKRRGKRNGGKRKMTIPLSVAAGFVPLVMGTVKTPGGWDRKLWFATQAMTGYDTDARGWWAPNLMKGMVPILAGMGVHLVMNRIGINRAIARMGIPLIRI